MILCLIGQICNSSFRRAMYGSREESISCFPSAFLQRLSKSFLSFEDYFSTVSLTIRSRVEPEVLQDVQDAEYLGPNHDSHGRTRIILANPSRLQRSLQLTCTLAHLAAERCLTLQYLHKHLHQSTTRSPHSSSSAQQYCCAYNSRYSAH
jgi:hypothetical protein